jgi:tRNA nucleotidyltransferase (CCA-adding enzyme)
MRELPPGWTFWGEETGATTTLLVEKIAEQGLPVNPTEASLLLLGIYEDTGALSYETTTARDLRSAAWLREHGASLLIVNKFLHHPLTEAQTQLYQQLADNSHPYQFHGQSVIIATASVPEPVEEVSTLAHKLHDLYEPAGLFMLVQMGDHIQLVARSTSDAIDVGAIAAAFGGGGHSRAAAAMIRNGTLHGTFETLVYLLQSQVRPPVTVAQIMSYGAPQTLTPADTITDAAERMRRYGFEGFPVVEEGRIVGMLTRREIDRAIHHGLSDHPVGRYMRAGEIYVTPDDSVETLRQVMTEHDWGQVPVVEAATGAILGIVTRTDLIKQWTAPVPLHGETLGERMAAALPRSLLDLLRTAGITATEMGHRLYAVGGFVRDLLLEMPNFDVDLVVEGDAIKLAHELARRLGGRVRSHRRFGTAKWIVPEALRAPADGSLPESEQSPPLGLDFVTARTEFYEHPTALPTVERSSIKQDLHRRDFTINTLAIRLDPDHWGELLDFYGGKKDLEERLIRVLHSLSFVEDPTRILRAARFEQRFHFHIEPRTEKLIADARDLLDRVSGERVRHELELILTEAEPERVFGRLAELDVLPMLHPELRRSFALCGNGWLQGKAAELRGHIAQVQDPQSQVPPAMALGPDAAPRLHLALFTYHLSPQAQAEFIQKFHIRKEYRDLLEEVTRLRGQLDRLGQNQIRPSEIVAALDESSDEARLLLRVVSDSWLVRQRLDQYQRRLRHVRPLMTGADLRRLGLEPGPVYRRILERLRVAHLDGEIKTREEEEAVVRQLLATSGEM